VVRVTGFGPFLSTENNPSAWLAERSGAPFSVIPVTFAAVEDALELLSEQPWQFLLLLGLASKSPTMRFESVACNRVGTTPDMDGVVWGPGPIDPAAPQQLHSTLWMGLPDDATDLGEVTTDAGGYLCNYILFRALQKFPDRKVGFLHVAESELLPLESQLGVVQAIVDALLTTQSETGWSRWSEHLRVAASPL
jgi:pyrrolidone-carboxylate peptidase